MNGTRFGLPNLANGSKSGATARLWAQYRDVLFPVAAILALGTFFVPLQPAVIDILVILNLAMVLTIVTRSLTISTPIELTSYPTILLITPVFRLCLSVSISRSILESGRAGAVIETIGRFSAGGNLVVAFVIFAMILFVQFIVVTKGAERVAEVAARFALDALPGKQMAIDADLRAGALDAAGARQRRLDLERESQLYGAMDGAMRFVKGDAIAAIIIVVINLVGGLVIGIGTQKLSAGAAIAKYSMLSIGAGLVAQIPALIVAVASGLLVTRVASTGDRALGDTLGDSLTAPLVGQPRVLGGAAALLVALAIVPGLPFTPFVALGALAAAGAVLAARA